MDMMMKPGAPSLTQLREVRTAADSFAFTDSGSDSSLDGGVALSPTMTQRPTTDSSMPKDRPSKEASKALRIRYAATATTAAAAAAAAAAASTGVTNEPSPVVAENPMPRLSKKARKGLRKRKAAASASASAHHGPSSVVPAGPSTTEQATTNDFTRSTRLSKKARRTLRKREAAAAAASASTSVTHEPSPVGTVDPTTTEQATADGSPPNTHLSKKARRTLRKKKAAAAANDLPAHSHPTNINSADTPADAPGVTGNESPNGVTEIVKTITATELNVLRAIEAKFNALGARLDEQHAQQMAWTEQKVREHRESGYGFGTMFFFLIIFLMIFSTYIEAEERRRSRWW
jgi:hypothetical protein